MLMGSINVYRHFVRPPAGVPSQTVLGVGTAWGTLAFFLRVSAIPAEIRAMTWFTLVMGYVVLPTWSSMGHAVETLVQLVSVSIGELAGHATDYYSRQKASRRGAVQAERGKGAWGLAV